MASIPVQADKPRVEIADGFHTGQVEAVDVNDRSGYTYMDVTLSVDGSEGVTIKAGYPLPICPSSMTGLLFARFGADVIDGVPLETGLLEGKQVQFATIKKDKYVEVQRETLKPAPGA